MRKELTHALGQAARCYRLAFASTDREIARQLGKLGRKFAQRAIGLGAEPNDVPQPGSRLG